MTYKKPLLAIGIFIIAIILVYNLRSIPQTTNNTENTITTTQKEEGTTQEKEDTNKENNKITTKELETHNNKEDCWIIYENTVYDITSYLPRHPGTPEKIMPYCGSTTFEEAFTKQHGTSKVKLLMKVGTLIGDFDIKGTTT